MRIRHNWPALCHLMTKAERKSHVDGLRQKAKDLRQAGNAFAASNIDKGADDFERAYPWKRSKKSALVKWEG